MDGSGAAAATYYRPVEVARMLRCSEWWVKEQARQRRIPYAWIGGSYLFTDAHVAEIVRLFEVRPAAGSTEKARSARRQSQDSAAPARLRARPPRRGRHASTPPPSAA